VLAASAYCHASPGRKDDAKRCVDELDEMALRQYVPPLFQALAAASVGDRDTAFRKLDDAVEEHCGWLSVVKVARAFDSIRDDERYVRLLDRIGLAAPAVA